jgi:hypothetical protein
MLVGYLFFFVAALDSRLPQNEMQVAMIFKLIAPSAKDNAQRLRMHAQKNAVLFFFKVAELATQPVLHKKRLVGRALRRIPGCHRRSRVEPTRVCKNAAAKRGYHRCSGDSSWASS